LPHRYAAHNNSDRDAFIRVYLLPTNSQISATAAAVPESERVSPPRRPSFARAFVPFWVTLVLGAIILAADYDRRNAPLTKLFLRVTVDGSESEEGFGVELNGKRINLENPVHLGSAAIRIFTTEGESITSNRFIWYGPHDLGTIDLRLGHGDLKVSVLPIPDMIEMHGRHRDATNVSGEFRGLPAGKYNAVLVYGDLREQGSTRVPVGQTNQTAWTANIGSLELASDPADAEFEITSKQTGESATGKLPHTLRRLRGGEYRVVMRRQGYEMERTVAIQPNETNRLSLRFAYGTAEISTEPPGADVWINGMKVGVSPMRLPQVVPSKYEIEVQKEGYDSQRTELVVEGDKVASTKMSLMNTVYRQSMEAVKIDLSQHHYGSALRNLEQALRAQPNEEASRELLPSLKESAANELSDGRYQQLVADARSAASNNDYDRALGLLSEAKGIRPDQTDLDPFESEVRKARDQRNAQLAEQRRQEQLAAGRRRAHAGWNQSLANEPGAALFPEEVMHSTKSISEIRAACDRIGAAHKDSKPHPQNPTDSQQLSLRIGSLVPLLGIGEYVRLHAYQVTPDESEIRMKYFAYGLGLGAVDGKPQPIQDPDLYKRIAAAMRKLLGQELGGDLK